MLVLPEDNPDADNKDIRKGVENNEIIRKQTLGRNCNTGI